MNTTMIRARDLRPGTTILSRPHRWEPRKIRDIITLKSGSLLLCHETGEYTVSPGDDLYIPLPDDDQQEALW